MWKKKTNIGLEMVTWCCKNNWERSSSDNMEFREAFSDDTTVILHVKYVF